MLEGIGLNPHISSSQTTAVSKGPESTSPGIPVTQVSNTDALTTLPGTRISETRDSNGKVNGIMVGEIFVGADGLAAKPVTVDEFRLTLSTMLAHSSYSADDFKAVLLAQVKAGISPADVLPKNFQHAIGAITKEQYIKFMLGINQLEKLAINSKDMALKNDTANYVFDLDKQGNTQTIKGYSKWAKPKTLIVSHPQQAEAMKTTLSELESLASAFYERQKNAASHQTSQVAAPTPIDIAKTTEVLQITKASAHIFSTITTFPERLTPQVKAEFNQLVQQYYLSGEGSSSCRVEYCDTTALARDRAGNVGTVEISQIVIHSDQSAFKPFSLSKTDSFKYRFQCTEALLQILSRGNSGKGIHGIPMEKLFCLYPQFIERNSETGDSRLSLEGLLFNFLINRYPQQSVFMFQLGMRNYFPSAFLQSGPINNRSDNSYIYSAARIIDDLLGCDINHDEEEEYGALYSKIDELLYPAFSMRWRERPSIQALISGIDDLKPLIEPEIKREAQGESSEALRVFRKNVMNPLR